MDRVRVEEDFKICPLCGRTVHVSEMIGNYCIYCLHKRVVEELKEDHKVRQYPVKKMKLITSHKNIIELQQVD